MRLTRRGSSGRRRRRSSCDPSHRRSRSISRTCRPAMRTADRRARRRSAARFVTIFRSALRDHAFVARLHQQAAVDAAVLVADVRGRIRRSPARARSPCARRFPALRRRRRRDDQFDELTLDDRARGDGRQRAIERDDAAECRGRVGPIRAVVRRERVACDRDAARIRVLDDDARRLGELTHAFERGIAVGDVVVRQRLALQLRRAADARARRVRDRVERARSDADSRRSADRGACESAARATPDIRRCAFGDAAEIARDGGVVARRVRVRFRRESLARLLRTRRRRSIDLSSTRRVVGGSTTTVTRS